jgi:hypothetical protein
MNYKTDRVVFECRKNGGSCGCPELFVEDSEHFGITDDFGGKIKLTKEQAGLVAKNLKKALKHLDKDI